ncbi:MAG: acetate CoA-transferase [Desulfitibacter sp. BRH_c19]|nr:MAG: acetate CoA-transferase [Desulfitibacter sp. BRH_c19]
MDKKEARIMIAKRIARELVGGTVVNLGIGMPTMCANYVPADVNVMFQSENGFIGIGPAPLEGDIDADCVNAGGSPVTILPGGCCFDSVTSFGIIRGGHIHTTVLGALQVDQEGNLANWMVPGKMVPGMGGAMDLVVGAGRVIIAMEHVAKDGSPKILKKCTLPLTAINELDLIVTDMAVISVTTNGLVLKEVAPGVTVEDVIKATEADLIIPAEVKTICV